MMDSLLQALGLMKGEVLSGFIGSVLSLRFYRDLGVWGKVTTFVGGWATAIFLTQPALTWFKLTPPESYTGGIGFVVGLFSMSIASAVAKVLRDTEWARIISKRFGGET